MYMQLEFTCPSINDLLYKQNNIWFQKNKLFPREGVSMFPTVDKPTHDKLLV